MAERYHVGPNFTAVCETCGAVVGNIAAHDLWHADLRDANGNGKAHG